MTITEARKQFFAVRGSRFNNSDAEIIGPVLEGLSAENKGPTADEVVEAARDEDSPIHPYFEWDDQRAAEDHRREQARQMCRSIKIRVVGGSGEVHETRGFQSVLVVRTTDTGEEVKESRYVPLEIIREEPDLSAQVIAQAGAQLKGWRERWSTYADVYEAFPAVFTAIDDALAAD